MPTIDEDQLLKLCKLQSRAALRKHLRKARIPFLEAGNGIFTTEEALTARMIGRAKKKKAPAFLASEGDN